MVDMTLKRPLYAKVKVIQFAYDFLYLVCCQYSNFCRLATIHNVTGRRQKDGRITVA